MSYVQARRNSLPHLHCEEGRVLFAKSPKKGTPVAARSLVLGSWCMARSLGDDSRNRALRLKERRKLETDRGSEEAGGEEGACDGGGGNPFSRWKRDPRI